MTISLLSVFSGIPNKSSDIFRRYFCGLTDSAVAIIDGMDDAVVLTTFSDKSAVSGDAAFSAANAGASSATVGLKTIDSFDLSSEDVSTLNGMCAAEGKSDGRWRGYRITLDSGRRDSVALQLEKDIDSELVTRFLERVWPLLRDECVARQAATGPASGDVAWSVLDRLDVAVFILDSKGLMYRLNTAAKGMLAEADFLKRGRGGLFAASDEDSRALRDAVAALAEAPAEALRSDVIFLTSATDCRTLPVTLSRYMHDGQPTRFVTATVPLPPSRSRIEGFARQLGLSGTEARVAALVQLGHTNREAAALAGVKEQTFNTYAKRIFSKLNVRNRSEMAQLLTWQSIGGV